jgi:hypothetical protein
MGRGIYEVYVFGDNPRHARQPFFLHQKSTNKLPVQVKVAIQDYCK